MITVAGRSSYTQLSQNEWVQSPRRFRPGGHQPGCGGPLRPGTSGSAGGL